jgi:hypothetical protein
VKLMAKLISGIVSFGLVIYCCGLSVADCDYNKTKYSERAFTCQSGHQYSCEDGTWIDMTVECQDAESVRTFDNSGCSCSDDDLNKCLSSGQKCSATQELGGCVRKCVE